MMDNELNIQENEVKSNKSFINEATCEDLQGTISPDDAYNAKKIETPRTIIDKAANPHYTAWVHS